MYKTTSCVFCHGAPVTNEHVWPEWVGKAFKKGFTVSRFRFATTGGKERRMQALAIKAEVVCGSCNNGWMSALERKASPILKRMMFTPGKTVAVNATQQATLSLWAYKTALMLDFINESLHMPASRYATLFAQKPDIPDGISVWTAAYNWRNAPLPYLTNKGTGPTLKVGDKVLRAPTFISATFSLGHALFHVLDQIDGGGCKAAESSFAPLFQRLHPPLAFDTLVWPKPRRAVPESLFPEIGAEPFTFIPPDLRS
jgi:hypothetical protein